MNTNEMIVKKRTNSLTYFSLLLTQHTTNVYSQTYGQIDMTHNGQTDGQED